MAVDVGLVLDEDERRKCDIVEERLIDRESRKFIQL
jgi:hypothetical protein